jgi:ABC-type sugar transport system ATPase subunit
VQTRAEILRLHARLKATVVYVTHDQVEAMTMGTRIAVMHRGVLQQVGTPQELYETPANRFVAGFIGSPAMNLVEATVADSAISFGNVSMRLGGARAAAIKGRSAVVAGFRPEHLRIGAASGDEIGLTLEADVVEYLGAQELLHLSSGAGDLLALVNATHRTSRGDRVPLALSPSQLHFFDAVTGAAIR